MEGKNLTLGEYRVGISFNPSKDSMVDTIKAKSAELIDLLEDWKKEQPAANLDAEIGRLISTAQSNFENGAMWAVKAVTKQVR